MTYNKAKEILNNGGYLVACEDGLKPWDNLPPCEQLEGWNGSLEGYKKHLTNEYRELGFSQPDVKKLVHEDIEKSVFILTLSHLEKVFN